MAHSREPASFSRFSSLPPELRLQIWHESVPDLNCITLHNYQKGYWGPRNLPKAESGANPEESHDADEEPITFSFHHTKLDSVHVDIQIGSVNHEARSVALAWIRKQGVRMLFHEARECHVFVHRFDPVRDALFVGLDQWQTFCSEPHNRLAEVDLSGHVVNNTNEVTRIAVPHTTIWAGIAALADVLHWYPRLRVMFIVLDIQLDETLETMLLRGDRRKVRARLQYQQWKVKEAPRRSLVWDQEERRFDWRGEGPEVGSSEIYQQMEEIGREMAQRLGERETGGFEIRPVYAVKG